MTSTSPSPARTGTAATEPGRTSVTVHPAFSVAPVSKRTFGSFVEHLGRCMYSGIYEPGHPTADEHGFRQDVLELTKQLGVTLVRYPGGNFVSGFRWEDSVGSRDQRPTRVDLAWATTETNEFGLDEFMQWCRVAEVEPMMAINLGTRGTEAAIDLFEYSNHSGSSTLADARVANTRALGATGDPHDIRLWCLGNEMDGPWQLGHKTAEEYGRLAAETARALRRADASIELVACGSSGSQMQTFGAWEQAVLDEAYDFVDYISLHSYYQESGDRASFLASAVDMQKFIRDVVAIADAAGAKRKSTKKIMLSYDEWNVWYLGGAASEKVPGYPVAPPILEDNYTVTDAVVVGSMLMTLLRNNDRVTVACQAQLVNVIAPIMTERGGGTWTQTIFHPFALTARYAGGTVLDARVSTPLVTTAKYGDVDMVDAVVTWDQEGGTAAVFLVNRSTTQAQTVEIPLGALRLTAVVEALTLHDDDPYARNSAAAPDRVVPRPNDSAQCEAGLMSIDLPSGSWTMVRLA
ncbi:MULTISPECIES: alpha-N-arabinofuranosidase [unclassified Rathayibacter]|uniref:arabinosylfuranosidase ArfA n=1 Tax=unclassified Rathayibacter TaxID=2609250 RepID=UPI000FA5A67C|nr:MULTISPECIES: alpha-N-arabinofuranosidase [unclassified Rathayibacter]ROP49133.1 alpha-N-arabinofuranosidase [Rathayibacter sp. PhB186]ROS50750.1 alpha-N-arabinofuranosidase [Rathayibacter sp. PhB185]